MSETILLQGNFKLAPSFKTVYSTTLTTEYIAYVSTNDNVCQRVYLKDVTGAKLKENGWHVLLYIFSYPLVKNGLWGKEKRRRREVVFLVEGAQDLNENKEIGNKWVKGIKRRLYAASLIQNDEPRNLQFLVLVNPFGGRGFALKCFNNRVKPMLEEADVNYDLKTTEYAGHAKEIAETLDLRDLDCILFCSGDGLIHEVVNGFMARPDWKEAILTPLGHIPCGSGNGLCASALHQAKEPFGITSAVFAVLRGRPLPLDVVKAETSDSKIHYSFLGIVHGIVADIDIDSEKYRFMGEMRFAMMAVRKIISKHCFQGKVWYLPLEETVDTKTHNLDFNSHHSKVDTNSISQGTKSHHPEVESTNHVTNEVALLTSTGKGTKSHQPEVASTSSVSLNECMGNGGVKTGLVNVILPNMADPLPEPWKCVDGNFVGWVFTSLSHIGTEAFVVPEAKLGAGMLYCVHFGEDMSRKSLMEMITKFKTGDYFDIPGVRIIKSKAFRFDMSSTHSTIATIDGECVKYGQIQAEVYKGLARVRCL